MAVIAGIGEIGGFKIKGFLPWFFWLAVHLVYFPDWRNRLMIFLTWLHNYLIGDRPARLMKAITEISFELFNY